MSAAKRLVPGHNGSRLMSFDEFWDVWRRHYAQWYRLAESVVDYRELRGIEDQLKKFVEREWESFPEEVE